MINSWAMPLPGAGSHSAHSAHSAHYPIQRLPGEPYWPSPGLLWPFLGFFGALFFLSCVLLLQSTHLHIIHHPCFRTLGSIGVWRALPGVLLADISSFDFRYLTSCQDRFAFVSKSAKQSNRKLFYCTANSRIGIQVLDSTDGLLVKLSAVRRSLQKLERARGYRNF